MRFGINILYLDNSKIVEVAQPLNDNLMAYQLNTSMLETFL